MTVFEKTWVTDGNRAISDISTAAKIGQHMVWYITRILLNNGLGLAANAGAWTCYYSCDGTTAGTAADGVDRWTTTFTPSKIVQSATTHSWFVLKSPTINGSNWYFIIDCNSASTNVATFVFSKTAPTGGTTSARPTATDEWSYSAQTYFDNSAVAYNEHANLATSGDFIFYFSKTGSGMAYFSIAFQGLLSTKSGDACPAASFCAYNTTSPGAWARSVNVNAGTAFKLRSFDDTTAAVNGLIVWPVINANSGIFSTAEMGTTDAADSKDDDFPSYFYVYTTGHKSLRGRWADITCTGESIANAVSEPTTGPPYQSAVIGNYWHPWGASAVPAF